MPLGTDTWSETRVYAPSGLRRHTRPGVRSAMYIEPSAPKARSSGASTGPSSGTTTSTSPEAGSTALICPARNCATYSRPSGPKVTPLEPHSRFALVSRRTSMRSLVARPASGAVEPAGVHRRSLGKWLLGNRWHPSVSDHQHVVHAAVRSPAMTIGLRERKKAATRQSLHDAAVRLAAEHGVEHLTVEAIADAATVSRRTFSNYFASKEQALLHHDSARTVRLVELIRARPAEESLMTAVIRAAEQHSTEFAADPAQEEHYRALRLHPALLPELVATYAAAERDLAEAAEERLPAGPDTPLRAQVLAATLLAAFRVVGQTALERREHDVVDLLRQAIDITREGFR
ncbi:hypothetical protein SANTM175S_07861 [Streptomyces antimycoticus]